MKERERKEGKKGGKERKRKKGRKEETEGEKELAPGNKANGRAGQRGQAAWFEKKIWIILLTSDLRKNKGGALQHVGENRVSWPHLSGRPVQKVPFQQLPTPPQPPPPRGPTSFLVRSNYSSCDS